MHYLRQHLPATGQILDAGEGPGRYTLELCRSGYEVVLLDISSELIRLARVQFLLDPEQVQHRLLDAVVGDVGDLSQFGSQRFDAVLCLGGPLTHIADQGQRPKAMSELVRVAKAGALVCVSVMGLLAVLRTIMMKFSDELLSSSLDHLLLAGNTTGTTGTMWHFFRADELRQLAESCGLTTITMAGCEGLSAGLAEATNQLGQDEAKWSRWLEVVLRTSAEPAVVDLSEHILYLGRAGKR